MKPARLRRALTWIGIVAGIVFIAAAIFISGAATGWLPGWHDQHRAQADCVTDKGDPPMSPTAGGQDCCGKKGPAGAGCCEPEKK